MREFFLTVAAIFRRDLLLEFTQPLGFFVRVFNSLVGVSGFFFLSRLIDLRRFTHFDHRSSSYFAYVTINLSFTALQSTALLAGSSAVRRDQTEGALEPIVATQRSALPYVVACGAWPLTSGLVDVCVSMSIATIYGLDLRGTNLLALSVFLVLGLAVMTATGVLSAALVIAFKRVPPTGYLIGGAAAMLAGTLFPVALLPLPLRIVSWLLPLTHSLRGLRAATTGAPLATLLPDAIWLFIATIVLLPLAYVALRAAVDRGRRDGTLSNY